MQQKKCPFCGKVIEGFTPGQVEFYWMQHCISKHPEKIEVKE